MMTDDNALLMSRFLEEELTDVEEAELFRLLSESAEARRMFAALREVKNSMTTVPDAGAFPATVDKRFSFLSVGTGSSGKRTPVSSSSLLLSLIGSALVLVMFLLSSGGSTEIRTQQPMDGPARMYAPALPNLPR